jgi:hypothetical protein
MYVFQDNFCSAAVFLDESVNLDVFAFELPHVADIADVAAKYDNAEPTGFLVFAEVFSQKLRMKWPAGSGLTLKTFPVT